MTQPADTWMYYRLHAAMISSSEHLAAAAAELTPDDQRRAAAIATWFDGFVGELHHHHMVEDEIFFPALAARVASYAGDHSEQLAADHALLDEMLGELAATFHALRDGAPWGWHHADAVALSVRLRDHLQEHLALEDTEVVPLFERHFTQDEYAVLDQQAMKSAGLGGLLFTVPWFVDSLDEAGKEKVLSTAALPLRLIYRATRRRYARRIALAFGDVDATRPSVPVGV